MDDMEGAGYQGYSLGDNGNGGFMCFLADNELIIEFNQSYELEELKTILNKRKIPYIIKSGKEDEHEDGYMKIQNADKYFEFKD
jgi:hypothetical protein